MNPVLLGLAIGASIFVLLFVAYAWFGWRDAKKQWIRWKDRL